MPMTPPPPAPSRPMTWSTSARVRSSFWPLRASEPIASTHRGPAPRLGFVMPSEGHQPPTTRQLGPTARVTSAPEVTTATGVPIHDPVVARAAAGVRAAPAVRALRAAATAGEAARPRSAPAYSLVTRSRSGPGAPATPEAAGADVEGGAPVPDAAGASGTPGGARARTRGCGGLAGAGAEDQDSHRCSGDRCGARAAENHLATLDDPCRRAGRRPTGPGTEAAPTLSRRGCRSARGGRSPTAVSGTGCRAAGCRCTAS